MPRGDRSTSPPKLSFFNDPIVHLLRHSLDFVSYKDRKLVAAALKEIYRAINAAAGEAALSAFEEEYWGRRYPAIAQSWRRAWSEVVPFYAFPANIRRMLYTTDDIDKRFVKTFAIILLHGRPRSKERSPRMQAPLRRHHRRSSFVASVRRFGPCGFHCRTRCSYAFSACSDPSRSRSRSSLRL